MSEQGLIQIGEVARRAGTTVRTVRYYLEEGLIGHSDRSPGGFYLFEPAAADRVGYIIHLRELGLSLTDISDLIDIRRNSEQGGQAARLLRQRLAGQLEFTERKIEEYRRLKDEIARTLEVLDQCADCTARPGEGQCGPCSVLGEPELLPTPIKAIYQD